MVRSKTCPFCGAEDNVNTTKWHGVAQGWSVLCSTCDARGPVMSSKAAALAAWDQASGSFFDDVVEWTRHVGGRMRSHVGDDSVTPNLALALELIEEEIGELRDAIEAGDLVEIADGAFDSVWVLCSYAAELGINGNAVWSEIKRSNFEKTGATRRADGKILKPEGWRPPDIKAALKVPISGR